VVAQGKKLYWDDSESELTLTATDNTFQGFAEAAAGNGVTTVNLIKAS
jgi:hypothetical protein